MRGIEEREGEGTEINGRNAKYRKMTYHQIWISRPELEDSYLRIHDKAFCVIPSQNSKPSSRPRNGEEHSSREVHLSPCIFLLPHPDPLHPSTSFPSCCLLTLTRYEYHGVFSE